MTQRRTCWWVMVAVLAAALMGCSGAAPAVPGPAGSCQETPAQDRWPEDYGLARGQESIWLIDNGQTHRAQEQTKVGWRVIGAVGSLAVSGRSLDTGDTIEFTVRDRVQPNGRDSYPTYWDAVSYLTFSAPGCWQIDLSAGGREEQIVLQVE